MNDWRYVPGDAGHHTAGFIENRKGEFLAVVRTTSVGYPYYLAAHEHGRLMAAAPEMLAALEEIASDGDDDIPSAIAPSDIARQAIAKAKGETDE